jgi:two-component system, response regulator PdtaR
MHSPNYLLQTRVSPFRLSSASPTDDSTSQRAAARPSDPASSPILRGKRVVIVEDEGITQMQLRKICLLAGMQVAGIASDGLEGVRKVLETRPDMVLMDIKMPVMDGLDAAALILRDFNVCVVMLTAYDIAELKQRAEAAGAGGYVLKPVSSTSLIPQMEVAYRSFYREPQ